MPSLNLIAIDLDKLKPTQLAVGFLEVEEKREKLKRLNASGMDAYLKKKLVPAVLGPGQTVYIIDHHHLVSALNQLGQKYCYVQILHDFSTVPEDKFFKVMDVLNLVYPFDAEGYKVPFEKIPKSIEDLKNDPYRALAGFVRKAGGFKKSNKPFTEFAWANFFRNHFTVEQIEQQLDKTVQKALAFCQSEQANKLPGFLKAGSNEKNQENPFDVNDETILAQVWGKGKRGLK